MKKASPRDLLFYIVILGLLLWTIGTLTTANSSTQMTYADLVTLFREGKVTEFRLDEDDQLTLYLREEVNGAQMLSYGNLERDLFFADLGDLINQQRESGVLVDYHVEPEAKTPWWSTAALSMGSTVVVFVLFYLLMARQQNAANGGDRGMNKFGKARTRKLEDGAGKKVTFDDVAGAEEEKEELREIVEFLRDPLTFTDLGARVPKGVLLVGPPGTGKTLLAKAVAGEAGVQFLSISGSDFVELYVGVGASRVRDLFDQAKKEAPAIVFIDEIDAVGRQRGAGLGGGHDEREQTLNQLLVEMDGFAANEGVIVLAATNRRDILDPALLRPGRFDRQVYVGYPDIKGREEILKVHARSKPLAEDVDLKVIAKSTGGFVGADLENLMNEAALMTARKGKRFITMEELHEATIKVIAGPEKRSRVVTEHAKELTAYHEAGHAVVIHELETPDPVHQITIIPRGMAGGMTISLPEEDKSYRSKRELEESIAVCLGGRVAEQLMLGDISTGASNDLERATATARAMVTKYGMSERLGTVVFDNGNDEVFIGRTMAQARSYSEEVAGAIDEEIHAIIDRAYKKCEEILNAKKDELTLTAKFLLEHETMSAQQFELVFTDPAALESVEETAEEEPEEKTEE